MAEIKSTLDLVLERTRHLSLSEDEKKVQHIQAIKQKCRGMVQRYGDKAINAEQFRRELAALEQSHPRYRPVLLLEIVLEMLVLEEDTTRFDLLGQVSGVDLQPLQQIGKDYRGASEAAAALRREEVRSELAERCSISGSAVVACLDGDGKWGPILENLQGEFGQRLDREKERLLDMTDQM
jgi:hypothetical protein